MSEKIERGSVWWVSLDPTQGSEVKKTRPCLVLSSNILNEHRRTVVVVPLSSAAKAHPPITVSVTCDGRRVVALIDQVRTVAKERLRSCIELATEKDVATVCAALTRILELMA